MKYKLGDYLYSVIYENIKIPCSECNSSGKINVVYKGKTTNIKCPECEGHGVVFYKGYSVRGDKIYAIQEDDEGIKVAIDDNWECHHWDYMKPEDIGYDTIEEAELEVKKLNAEQKK